MLRQLKLPCHSSMTLIILCTSEGSYSSLSCRAHRRTTIWRIGLCHCLSYELSLTSYGDCQAI